MEVKQIATMMNEITNEILGTENIVTEDLSNIVDVGDQIINANAIDAYVRTLVNHIGRVIFVDRVYQGTAPSVLMDGWEYGSILEKITSDELPEAVENDSWNLVDGESYDPYIFHAPKVSAKFFNKRVTFEIEMSFTERQIKQSFSNVNQLNAFISMIQISVENSMTVKLDSLIARTINNMIAEILFDDYGHSTQLTEKSGIKAVNLLYLYNQTYNATLTADKAITTPDFIRFAAYQIGLYKDRLTKISTLFNIGGKERFTPTGSLNVVLLSEFKRAADVFLQSKTFHEEYTKLVDAEVVPYWQGSGKDYSFENTSKINVKLASSGEEPIVVEASGILGFMFDRNALGVCNLNRRVTTAYNPKGEYYNNFYKMDAGYFNDGNENAIVFFVA